MTSTEFNQIVSGVHAIVTFQRPTDSWGEYRYSHWHVEVRGVCRDAMSYNKVDFVADAQFDNRRDESYGWGFKANTYGGFDVNSVECARNVLRKVARAQSKFYEEQGEPIDFPEYVNRILKSLKVENVFITCDDSGKSLGHRSLTDDPVLAYPKQGGELMRLMRAVERNRFDAPKNQKDEQRAA